MWPDPPAEELWAVNGRWGGESFSLRDVASAKLTMSQKNNLQSYIVVTLIKLRIIKIKNTGHGCIYL